MTKPGFAASAAATLGSCAQPRREQLGQLHRRLPGGLGEDQRRVGGGIAVARIARRLDRDPLDRQIAPAGSPAACAASIAASDVGADLGERVHQ